MSGSENGRAQMARMHRRRSSKEDAEVDPDNFKFPRPQTPPVVSANGANGLNGHAHLELPPSPPRTRVVSTPSTNGMPSYLDPPPSAGHQRTTFGAPRPLSMINGSSLPPRRHQSPAMRQSLSLPGNSHSRARSISGPFSPASPSPLSFSFPADGTPSGKLPASATAPEMRTKENGISPSPSLSSQAHTRRHSRIHSRNLSVFFPRPGTLPSTAIAEDGAQEITYGGSPEGVPMPSASPGPGNREFRQGFSFGGQAPTSAPSHPMRPMGHSSSSSNGNSRRGHHHKHSLSHSFFSFLEPGANHDELHTTPAPVPVSPWMPISPFLETPVDEKQTPLLNGHATRDQSPPGKIRAPPRIAPEAVGAAVTEFLLGVWLWITAQQVGSLACTGLGYWVVFDALGVALAHIVPGYLASPSTQAQYRRPFGNARVETVVAFAQSVYLIFASVYVCKETVEHLLLSSGEGHHHHNGDEVQEFFGVDFPFWLLLITLTSLLTTTFGFNNHSKLVSTAGNHIPPLTTYIPSRYRYFASSLTYPPRLMNLLTNPYTLAPIAFCIVLIVGPSFIPPWQHRYFDLVLAGFETVVTFSIAYSAAVALGTVLLQTSPARGLVGGRMEAFLRAMREIERHPQVVHLPAPHIWQLTPNLSLPQEHWMYAHHPISAIDTKAQGPAQSLIVTLELHVRRDLDDDQVLGLTKWAWERCSHALHFGSRGGEGGEAEAEVTVGIVRE
ncbi:uncharacterized protein C8Q71DRAFT_444080 [Rhodofomes roseus]|uniref:Cation efflux protein transmembrane domain-containing protein n=1 Tax=Rhodofomes roseus TaxID=34475 RepID=A0ABQ8JYK6_9APHY|nr:uncharacterized protein C8Q71DRAFT_444080 [Rhodofomes roseus]KAH9829248.1 hypothetical protein C8Q71DRAFT_444080 [Rhodofomes roseus]